jgi:hypothetical protein
VRGSGAPTQRRFAVAALAVASLGVAAGCGGGTRQDADEPSGDFKIAVVRSTFPRAQGLADTSPLRITIRNEGTTTVPNVALTVDGISAQSAPADNADRERPIWIINGGPTGGGTAYVNTWALGPLKPAEEKTFTWSLTAIRAGIHTLRYRAAAGLNGKARAVESDGGPLDGSLTVRVTRRPRDTQVDPKTGKVVPVDG